jgi:hypothetical protein
MLYLDAWTIHLSLRVSQKMETKARVLHICAVMTATLLVMTPMMYCYSVPLGPSFVEIPSRPPDYEVWSQFDQQKTLPLHTEYWVAPSGVCDPTAIQGFHEIVEDNGVEVLRVQSNNMYQVGFGDHIIGYGPKGAHADPNWDIGDRVLGKPSYYFNYEPGGPPDVSGRPFTPAFWNAELDVIVKPKIPSKMLDFEVDNWIYYGLDPSTGKGNTITAMVWYDRNTRTLFYSYGNYPNTPVAVPLIENYVPPDGYFTIRYKIDYANKLAEIQWGDVKFVVPLAVELGGYEPSWLHFDNFGITINEPGELLIKSFDLKLWDKIPQTLP